MDLPVLDVSHQWNHTPCVLLCLASLTEHPVFKVHPRGSECQCFTPFQVMFLGVEGRGVSINPSVDIPVVPTWCLLGIVFLGSCVSECLCCTSLLVNFCSF